MNKRILLTVISSLLVFFIAGCSSPEEQALEFNEKGQALLEAGSYDKAVLEFRNALQLNGNLKAAYYGLALANEQKGNTKAYFENLKRTLELDGNHLDALLRLGRFYLIIKQIDSALQLSKKAIEVAPDNLDALSLHASVLLGLDDREKANELAQQVLDADPRNVEALTTMAALSLYDKDVNRSLEYIHTGLNKDENNFTLLLLKLKVSSELKDYHEIERTLVKLLELYPANKDYRTALLRLYAKREDEASVEKLLRKSIKLNSNNIQYKAELISFLNIRRSPEAAENQLKQFIAEFPKNTRLKFLLVQWYQSNKQHGKAKTKLKELSETEEKLENRVHAKNLLAKIALNEGNLNEALKLSNEVVSQDSRNEAASMIIAANLVANEKLDDAIALLRSVLKDKPDSPAILKALSKIYLVKGMVELAEDTLAKAVLASNHDFSYSLEYYRYLMKAGKTDRAFGVMSETLEKQPDNISAMKIMARQHLLKQNWAEAEQLANKIAEKEPNSLITLQILGDAYSGKQDYEKSIETYQAVYQAAPQASRPIISLVKTYVKAGKVNEALDFLNNVLSLNENNVTAQMLKAQVMTGKKALKEAADIYVRVIELAPENTVAYLNLSRIFLTNGRPDLALEVLDKGLVKNKDNVPLLMSKATVFQQSQQYDDAIKIYEQLQTIEPDSEIVVNNLASLLSEYKDDEDSLNKAYGLAKKLENSDFLPTKDTLSWIYYRKGEYEIAKQLLDDLVSVLPNQPRQRYRLGLTMLALGEQEAAKNELQMALDIAGDSPFTEREKVEETLIQLGIKK